MDLSGIMSNAAGDVPGMDGDLLNAAVEEAIKEAMQRAEDAAAADAEAWAGAKPGAGSGAATTTTAATGPAGASVASNAPWQGGPGWTPAVFNARPWVHRPARPSRCPTCDVTCNRI